MYGTIYSLCILQITVKLSILPSLGSEGSKAPHLQGEAFFIDVEALYIQSSYRMSGGR